ncbi:MAG: hypothetical protein AAF830_15435 [Pseudomonadota bacterium]
METGNGDNVTSDAIFVFTGNNSLDTIVVESTGNDLPNSVTVEVSADNDASV